MIEYVTKCDKCGKNLELTIKEGSYYKYDASTASYKNYFDFCESCEQEFSELLKKFIGK